MTILQAIILGLVEGITEYLPISSTGHLILAQWLLGLNEPGETKHAADAMVIVIQGGAILAVLGLYRRRVGGMLRGLLGHDPPGRRLLGNLAIAFLPAAVVGPLLNDPIEQVLFRPLPILAALAVGGLVMIGWRRIVPPPTTERSLDELTWRHALLIGAFQCLAMWPGTSRSMITILAGMLVGMRAARAAEFSFLLGVPTLAGACAWRLTKDLAGEGPNLFETLGVAPVLVGFVVATIAAGLAVTWLVSFLARHGLALFGWYRLALVALMASLLAGGVLSITPSEAPARQLDQGVEKSAEEAAVTSSAEASRSVPSASLTRMRQPESSPTSRTAT